jgi:transcriptional regulator with XRE-family HTH domain
VQAGPRRSAQHFVSWLEDLIAMRGLSWRRFAIGAAVSPSALSALRTGRVGRPSMETCYRIARYLGLDPGYVQRLGGYELADQPPIDLNDPELDLMFHQLMELSPEEREPVKEFVRYALMRAAARRRSGDRRE